MSKNEFPPMVIMGVSGSGKSAVGELLGRRLGIPFIDGDDLHPAMNKEKMRAGIPLEDADRRPWLQEIGRTLREHQKERKGIIIACSALKRRYRDLLREYAAEVLFIHLEGAMDILAARMAARSHEFMPGTLLASQLEALEPLDSDERQLMLDIRHSPAVLVDMASQALEARTTPAGE